MSAPARLHRMAAALGLLLLAIGFYWKLTLTGQYAWFDHPDMCYLEIPRLQFQAREIHQGRFPLWDPLIWSGQPLVGQTQPGPLFPLNLLFALLPLRDGYIRFELLNWYYVIVRFLAAWFCYLLCRELGRSQAASVLVGCAFGFGGFVGTVAWLDVANGAIWTPLIFLYLFRALRGERPAASAALSGFWLGVAALSGHHEIPMLTAVAAAGVWLWATVTQGRPASPRLRLAALAFLAAGLVAAVQALPTYEFGRLSRRWVGVGESLAWNDPIPQKALEIYSMPPSGLLGILLSGRPTNADSNPFLGLALSSLAALGLLGARRDPRLRWMAALAAAAAVYSMGVFTPVYGALSSAVPLLAKARVPVRGIHLLNFGLVVLAAHGADVVLDRCRLPWLRRFVFAVLLALALTELYLVGTANYSDRSRPGQFQFVRSLTENQDIVDFLRREQRSRDGPLRIHVNYDDLLMNFGDWHGFDMLQGYVAGATANMRHHGFHTRRTQDLFGVTHWLAKSRGLPDQQEVFAGASGLKVWRNPEPMPRAWAVHETETVQDEIWMGLRIQDDAWEFRRKALLIGEAPALESCAGEDQVQLRERSSDRIVISARLPCRGMVILAETNFPGWRALVDGKPARVWNAYGALRGAVVEGGEHTIEFRYRPLSVYLGAALTTLGVLMTAWLVRRAGEPGQLAAASGRSPSVVA